ncbi:PREDICTED: cap-specific mRNA (nucleoside-2'-O-)-methyltransferase 1-like [Dinoponera quadriceps]|uniref:Cap-specific mRNA (nucleoside-2'-O-)-methyltransferase 1 n=1 Tax=Dinoponera quadriceps TaxID=609295 RepID=A0A6P3YAC8_DINQU|nr:PREDICTED: cap-specific mRNA (nucleoside-2'-O-)-methyltransferase 1-like [Dinoponera quadriceps]
MEACLYQINESKMENKIEEISSSSDAEESSLTPEIFKFEEMHRDPLLVRAMNSKDTFGPVYQNNKRKTEVYEDRTSSSDDDVGDQYSNNPLTGNQVDASSTDESACKRQKLDNENESKTNDVSYIGKTQRMMEKMGYHPGRGLGKHSQGRVEPVELFMQRGRRGFGHAAPKLQEASLKWNPEEEVIKVVEDIDWLRNRHPFRLLKNDVQNWMALGPKKEIIDDETRFCDAEMMAQLISSKTMFDGLNKVEMRKARTRSNPYETIRTAGFLNRAAVKMANINKACNFMFTDGIMDDETLYFADVCAGPGGFSEYVLSRKKWHAKGFGFTLKNENDFKLDEFFAGPCETFHPFYGSKENGDVYDSGHQIEFRDMIMKHTYDKGVHFMMSDGGFSVEGQENIQEILSKRLYLCQCLIALMIVRPGGHFVTKLFDLFTPFSVGLVYLMYRCFASVCIFKPNTSRPANSERYLICKGKKEDTEDIMNYLFAVNETISNISQDEEDNDVIQLVPLSELEADEEFMKYLRESNDTLGRRQIMNLLKIAAFCEDTSLIESKQAEMRKLCLQHWDLPDKSRVRPYNVKPQDKVREILNNAVDFIGRDAQKLTKEIVNTTLCNQPYDWYWVPCSSGQYVDEDKVATFYLGLGRRRVYRYMKGKWESIGDVKLELPPNTLVYAELVYESKWTERYFTKSRALHILDAYMLGGEDVSMKYITHR